MNRLMKVGFGLTILVALVTISSCRKKEDPAPPPRSKAYLLTKLTSTGLSRGESKPKVTTLSYNAEGRITSIQEDRISYSFVYGSGSVEKIGKYGNNKARRLTYSLINPQGFFTQTQEFKAYIVLSSPINPQDSFTQAQEFKSSTPDGLYVSYTTTYSYADERLKETTVTETDEKPKKTLFTWRDGNLLGIATTGGRQRVDERRKIELRYESGQFCPSPLTVTRLLTLPFAWQNSAWEDPLLDLAAISRGLDIRQLPSKIILHNMDFGDGKPTTVTLKLSYQWDANAHKLTALVLPLWPGMPEDADPAEVSGAKRMVFEYAYR